MEITRAVGLARGWGQGLCFGSQGSLGCVPEHRLPATNCSLSHASPAASCCEDRPSEPEGLKQGSTAPGRPWSIPTTPKCGSSA